ncbi:MAG: beta-galactosidase [Sedimentisphaerales bacterium]|nr:beta-galactosidase [Sedimentisphaerales bacterium]
MSTFRNTRRDFLSQSVYFGTAVVASSPLVKLFAMNSDVLNTQPARLTKIVPDGKPHKFETRNKQFLIDGDPTIIIAGEMHFGRILPEDFETRVKQARAMGLNTLSFYLFWNLTEPQEGKFDFTGRNDIRRMFKICQDNGMWVILRPGPYCCAEVEYGGIPYWTCKYPDVKIRTNDPKYVEWSKRYIERIGKEVADMQVTKGGPILMVQMENEFGMVAYASGGFAYMNSLQTIFRDAGFEVPLMVCDPGGAGGGRGGSTYPADVLRGPNGLGASEMSIRQVAAALGDLPIYSPEIYTAWFSGWGQPVATRHTSIQEVANETSFFLDHNVSWCYYMFFGGTNWGFNTGCNEFLPLQTSYNYSAPVDEAGRITPKFNALRAVIAEKTGRNLPEPPLEPVVAALPTIKFTEHEPLIEWLPAGPTAASAKPISMENLNQDYGFVLYRKTFPMGVKGTLELRQARDYTITIVNGKTVGKSFLGLGVDSNKITLNETGPVTLDLLVHNLGRISVITSANSQNRAIKGLVDGAYLDGNELTDWQIYSLPMPKVDGFKASAAPHTGPTFYHAAFNIDKPVSTFLDMRNFSFGVVWVNGYNLGRFWDRGGTRSLFLSGHFLKSGTNDIIVLELHDPPKTPEIAGTVDMISTEPVPFAIRLDNAAAGGGTNLGRRGAGSTVSPGAGGARSAPMIPPGGN